MAGAELTSAQGNFCHEATIGVLRGFSAAQGIAAAVLCAVEGITDTVTIFTGVVCGYIADRLGHRKLLALIGYALTLLERAFIALSKAWPLLLGRVVF